MHASQHIWIFAERPRARFALVALCIALGCGVATVAARAQPEKPAAGRRQVQFETGASFGNLHLFAYDENRALHPVGVEYDRPWMRSVIKGNLEYVSEVLPLIILNRAAKYGVGNSASNTARKNQYGFGVAPAGFRLLWRPVGLLQPYFGVKGGAAYFKSRGPSVVGSRMQFISEFSAGVERAVSARWGFRAGFSDFHMTNLGRSKSASDFLYFNGGLSYRF